jgi:Uma2 family endonuclease
VPPMGIKPPTSQIVMNGVSWQTYKTLMAEVGDNRAWRIAYDRGLLEIRMPLEEHEEPKGLLESFVEVIADELEIEVRKLGALTLDRDDLSRAIEPDSCFYIQNEALVRGRKMSNNRSTQCSTTVSPTHSEYSVNSINETTMKLPSC